MHQCFRIVNLERDVFSINRLAMHCSEKGLITLLCFDACNLCALATLKFFKLCKVGCLLNRMLMTTNRYAMKLHEIAFVKCFNPLRLHFFIYRKKCDMFLIAMVRQR